MSYPLCTVSQLSTQFKRRGSCSRVLWDFSTCHQRPRAPPCSTFLLIGHSSIRITVRSPNRIPKAVTLHLHSCITLVDHRPLRYQCSSDQLASREDVQYVERYGGFVYLVVKRLSVCEATPHLRKQSRKTHIEGYTSMRCMQGKYNSPPCVM